MQSAKGRSFARVPVSPPESGGGARSPFQAETGDRDDAGAVDSDQSPTSRAPLWPKRFDGLAYEDRRAKGWHWVGVPIGNAGGNANSQDDGECETLHQSLSSVTKEGRTQPAECVARIALRTKLQHQVFPVSGQSAKHHRPRQLERGAGFLHHGPRALLALGQLGQNPLPTLGYSPIRFGGFEKCFHFVRLENAKS